MSYRSTLKQLAGSQKPSSGAPAYSRLINRRAGRYLAAAAHQMGLTPDVVTLISALFSLVAIVMLALLDPTPLVGLAVSAGLVIGYALDSADGQLARLRGGGTRFGEWLDHMVDASKISSLHLAVLICVYRFFEVSSSWLLLVPIGYSIVATVMFFGMTLTDQLRRSAPSADSLQTQPNTWRRSLMLLPTDYGLLCLTYLLLGWHTVFLSVYAALLACNALFLLLALGKWSRNLRSLDAVEHSAAR